MTAIAILYPGDMGHAVGRVLRQAGHQTLTALAERSPRTRRLAEAAVFDDLGDLAAVVARADLVLSILPPAAAEPLAVRVADLMAKSGRRPVYVDCNAIAPARAQRIGGIMRDAGADFIDGGIIGLAPAPGRGPRLYVSGPDCAPVLALDGSGITVKQVGADIGAASGLKMCYAALTKGRFTLHTAVLLAAESLGLSAPLQAEFQASQADDLARMRAVVPRLPADAGRWVGEMEEIAATFAAAGVTPAFHEGAAAVFRLLAETPYAAEDRETIDAERTLEEAVATYKSFLPMP